MNAMKPGIDLNDLRLLVIRPVLAVVGLGDEAAEELLLGTALQESGGGRFLAQRGGPALGLWQMEPRTHDDIWENYLAHRDELAGRVRSLTMPGLAPQAQLAGNLCYACAMARLVYERIAAPLPAAGDTAAQAAYYKTHYNTDGGAATVAAYLANWRAAFG